MHPSRIPNLWQIFPYVSHDVDMANDALRQGKMISNRDFAALIWERSEIPTCCYGIGSKPNEYIIGNEQSGSPLGDGKHALYFSPAEICMKSGSWVQQLGSATMASYINRLESESMQTRCRVQLYGESHAEESGHAVVSPVTIAKQAYNSMVGTTQAVMELRPDKPASVIVDTEVVDHFFSKVGT